MLGSTRHLCRYQLLILFCFNTLVSLATSIPTDNPPTLNILHYHHASTANLSTRAVATSRRMSDCPNPLTYIGSVCQADQSVQAVEVACQEGGSHTIAPIKVHWESCKRNEVCIDLESDPAHPEAYCIANAAWNVLKYGSTKAGMRNLLTAETWVRIAVPKEGGEPVPLRAAQAKLVGKFTPIKLDADFLVLAAYREEWVEDEPVRRLTGSEDCKSCFDVTMMPVPHGTGLLRAKVIAPPHVEGLGGATLYLFTVE